MLRSCSQGLYWAIRPMQKERGVIFTAVKSGARDIHLNKTSVGMLEQKLDELDGVELLLEVLQFRKAFLITPIVH